MRCLHCDYLLFNLVQPVCPECGRGFDVAVYRFEHDAVSFNCPHCDQAYFGNDHQGLPSPRSFECVQCHTPVTIQELRVVPRHDAAMGEEADVIPWEIRRPGTAIAAWWATVKMLLFHPTQFFRMGTSRSTYKAWIFALVTSYLGMAVALVYSGLYFLLFSSAFAPPVGTPMPMGLIMLVVVVASFVIGPLLLTTLGAWVAAALIHVALAMFVPERRDFDHTVRLTLYAFAANVLWVVPVVGDHVAGVWGVVIAIIGIREWHRTTGWRAAIAKLWPLVILLGIVVVFALLLVRGHN